MSGLTADVINEFLKRPPREGLELRGDFEVQLYRVVMATIDLVHLLDDQDNCNIFVTAVNDLRQLISDTQEREIVLDHSVPLGSMEPNENHHIFDDIVEARPSKASGLHKLKAMLNAHADYVDSIVSVLP